VAGEEAILERPLRATPRPTIVMIARRLESLRHCQRILVFEGGRLVSDGSSGAFRAHDCTRLPGMGVFHPCTKNPRYPNRRGEISSA
jgi:ABC-type transport system involved in cytochrome bd biosynthesis fused ATPase/permease subunit